MPLGRLFDHKGRWDARITHVSMRKCISQLLVASAFIATRHMAGAWLSRGHCMHVVSRLALLQDGID